MYKILVLFSYVVVIVTSNTSEDVYTHCGDSIKCAEENLIKLVDNFDSKPSIALWGDYLSLEKQNEETLIERSQEGIVERLIRYITNHELRIKLPSRGNLGSFVEEARKSKLKRLILPVLLLLKLKALIVIPAILFVIALVAFKGMGAGLMALMISSGVALKHLLERSGSSSVSYEIVPSYVGPHWSRNSVQTVDGWTGIVPSYQGITN